LFRGNVTKILDHLKHIYVEILLYC